MNEHYTIITRADCPYCDQAKKLLSQQELTYKELQIGVDIDREVVLESYPESKVLPIVIKHVVVGGYNDLLDDVFPSLGDD